MTIQPSDITLSFVSESQETGRIVRRVDVNADTLVAVVATEAKGISAKLQKMLEYTQQYGGSPVNLLIVSHESQEIDNDTLKALTARGITVRVQTTHTSIGYTSLSPYDKARYCGVKQKPNKGKGPRGRWGEAK